MSENKVSRFKIIGTRDIFVLTIMAFISFVIESTIGLFLIPIIPIPLVGGFASSILDAIIIFTGVYSVPRIGSALYFGILLLAMSTVTPSFGPPGLYKILIGLCLGLVCELILLIFGRRDIVYIIGTGVAFALSIPVTYWAWIYAKVSAVDLLRPYLLWFTLAYGVLGVLGAWLGWRLYKTHLLKYQAVIRIREGN